MTLRSFFHSLFGKRSVSSEPRQASGNVDLDRLPMCQKLEVPGTLSIQDGDLKEPLPIQTTTTLGARVRWRDGSFPMAIVGESFHQEALIAICGKHRRYGSDLQVDAVIAREPNNPHDGNAVAVLISGRKVGHLSREAAAGVSDQMREQGLDRAECAARIRGGWRTNQHDEGAYGVYLAIPQMGWIEFGTGARPPASSKTKRRAVKSQ